MVTIQLAYQGDLHCEAVHEPSGVTLATDAPKDNQGRGESFSPTDLVAVSLGSCILTVMGIMARSLAIPLEGTTATVVKTMTNAPKRMIQGLAVTVHVPHQPNEAHKQQLEQAAHHCPVKQSLHPDIQLSINFDWGKPL